jgi:bifunctional DNA-binding transcriptional regulator/antitoxin component of YhaV-PrlF toxin-antitoxin module
MTSHSKLQDEWVPLPSAILRTLGWEEGQPLELEVIDGTLVITLADPEPDRPWQKPARRVAR